MYDSKLERDFHKLWKKQTKVPLKPQHKFHPVRKWAFDFAHIPTLTAIEIQGYGEGHTSYEGMMSDYEKHNEALRYGWVTIYIMSAHLTPKKAVQTIRYILDIIQSRPERVQPKLQSYRPRSPYEAAIERLLDDRSL